MKARDAVRIAKSVKVAISIIALITLSPWTAKASPINSPNDLDPGDTVSVPVFTGTPTPPLLSLTTGFGPMGGQPGPAGEFTETVFNNDPGNPFSTNYLSVIYKIAVTTGDVASVSLDGFTGYDVAVKACSDPCFYNGVSGSAPDTAARSDNGDTVSFLYDTLLSAGHASEFTIFTDAIGYSYSPSLYITDSSGDTLTLSVFGPAAIPVPATLPLFASGLGAMGFLRWRRKRRTSSLACER